MTFIFQGAAAGMVSTRSSVALLCLVVLLLVADVAAVAQAGLPQEQTPVSASTKQFYLRGGEAVSMLAETETAVEESLESFERRELSDYGSTPSDHNCSGNCK